MNSMLYTSVRYVRYAVLLMAALVLPSAVFASHFEFCWLTGTVETFGEATEEAQHFAFRVESSLPARSGSVKSYDSGACDRFHGTVVEAQLPLSFKIPKSGQLELIQRLWIDIDGRWWRAWEATDGWEIDDGSGAWIDVLNDR